MNVFFRMSEEPIFPPSGIFQFQNKVIPAYEKATGIGFHQKIKNKIPGNLGTFDASLKFCIQNIKGGGHGTVSLSQFQNAFFAPRGEALMEKMEGFVFAVIDHNSAHHLSYALAKRALSKTTARRKMVLNFDRHQDYGSASSTIACDTWGYFTTNGPTRCADLYAAVGTYCPEGSHARRYSVTTERGSQGAHWVKDETELMRHLGIDPVASKKEIALYITVDRDWTTYSRTPYGDGYYPYDSAYNTFLIPFLSKIKHLVASIDIIGLPGPSGSSRYGDATSHKTPNDYGKVAAKHIRSVYDAVA